MLPDPSTSMRGLLRASELDRGELLALLDLAAAMKASPRGPWHDVLAGPPSRSSSRSPRRARASRSPRGHPSRRRRSSSAPASFSSAAARRSRTRPVSCRATARRSPCGRSRRRVSTAERRGYRPGRQRAVRRAPPAPGPRRPPDDPGALRRSARHSRGVRGRRPDNVCHSLIEAGALAGMHVDCGGAARLRARRDDPPATPRSSRDDGGAINVTADPREAVWGAQVVATDVFVSMGEEASASAVSPILAPYRVTADLMDAARARKPSSSTAFPLTAAGGRRRGHRRSGVDGLAAGRQPDAHRAGAALRAGDRRLGGARMRLVIALGGNALLRPGSDPTSPPSAGTSATPSRRSPSRPSQRGRHHPRQRPAGRSARRAPLERSARCARRRERGPDRLPDRAGTGQVVGDRPVATLLTQTIVDAERPRVLAPDEARRLCARWRRRRPADVAPDGPIAALVPSPEPRGIVELPAVRLLVDAGVLVLCVGGGGVPVVADHDGRLRGVEAVIDKDLAAALLAAASAPTRSCCSPTSPSSRRLGHAARARHRQGLPVGAAKAVVRRRLDGAEGRGSVPVRRRHARRRRDRRARRRARDPERPARHDDRCSPAVHPPAARCDVASLTTASRPPSSRWLRWRRCTWRSRRSRASTRRGGC